MPGRTSTPQTEEKQIAERRSRWKQIAETTITDALAQRSRKPAYRVPDKKRRRTHLACQSLTNDSGHPSFLVRTVRSYERTGNGNTYDVERTDLRTVTTVQSNGTYETYPSLPVPTNGTGRETVKTEKVPPTEQNVRTGTDGYGTGKERLRRNRNRSKT